MSQHLHPLRRLAFPMTKIILFIFAWAILYVVCEGVRSHSEIDPDTKDYALKAKRRKDGKLLDLTFSDEFSEKGRSFAGDNDPFFSALSKPDDTNMAIQFYNSSKEYVTTKDGNLVITTRAIKTDWVEWVQDSNFNGSRVQSKNYTSGMVQSWNKFCFTGGVLEMSIQLPGHSDSGGIWPAVWLMGNLARATFDSSVLYQWPWSYDRCPGMKNKEAVLHNLDPAGKQAITACDPDAGKRG